MDRRLFLLGGLVASATIVGAATPPTDDKWVVVFFRFKNGYETLVYIGPFDTPRYFEATAIGTSLLSDGILDSTSHYCARNEADARRHLQYYLRRARNGT
jgi:hypothetical protein